MEPTAQVSNNTGNPFPNFFPEWHGQTTAEPTRSPNIAQLAAALAKAQGAMRTAEKSQENADYQSRYADLASVFAACREALSANELAVVQQVANSEKGVLVTTTLLHSSGEWICDRLEVPVTRRDAQALGSAITYGRRYSLAALVGVAAGEDDDGAAASAGAGKTATRQQTAPRRSERPAEGEPAKDAGKQVIRQRGWALWEKSKAAGCSKKEFLGWAAQVLGVPKTDDAKWTLEEVERLEAAHEARQTEAA